jgi:hypothetical protein
MKPVANIRRDRLAALVRENGKAVDVAKRANKDPRQISAWLKGIKKISDPSARELERACLKPSGWLDHEGEDSATTADQPSQSSQYGRTDRQKMSDAIRLLQELAELQGVPDLVFDPVAISVAYDFLVEFGTPITEGNVLDITKRLAAKIRGERDANETSSAA